MDSPALTLLGEPAGDATPIVLADLSRCEPADALGDEPRRFAWRTIPYATDAFEGVMLMTGEETAARQITLPLEAEGTYAIHIGMLAQAGPRGRVMVRFDDEPHWVHLKQPRVMPTSGSVPEIRIHDMFWRVADVTNRRIAFKQFTLHVDDDPDAIANRGEPAWIAYVKLTPVATQTDPPQKRVWAHHDCWCCTGLTNIDTRADLEAEIEPLRGGDFERVYWECGLGDRPFFFDTKSNLTPDADLAHHSPRTMERIAARTWKRLREQGLDPLRVIAERAHELDMELHATWRPGGFKFRPPNDHWHAGGAYDRLPHCRCVDREGRTAARLSFAYPEVRRAGIDLLVEAAQYPIDGICIAYNRRLPLVEYEQPLLDAFKAETGRDAREVDERDPQWLQFRCKPMTDFMTELRAALDATGKKLAVTVIVMATPEENFFYSLDLKAWIDAGLVDALVPYSSEENDTCSTFTTWDEPAKIDWLLDLVRGTDVKLAPNLLPRRAPATSYLNRAAGLYRRGVENLFIWDVNHRYGGTPAWSAIRRLGHLDDILSRAGREPVDETPGHRLRLLADWNLDMMCPG